ncbi:THO complex subunit 6-like [Ctenocephalides felis]|uniref:THO complex subunit 6-like n=1 Tax=Ctenocephalides felis TaxID=7515 RepID=UPI000E6E2253|nr:THO complex subunit 6-like [Ctenocephalides felis]
MVNKLFYNTVLSQCFSNCGKYLITGNLYGDISIFDLDNVLNPTDAITSEIQKPVCNFSASANFPVWSLVMTNTFLVAGSVNEIFGWNFKSLLSSNVTKPAWTIKTSSNRNNVSTDVNTIWYDSINERILAGCSDGIMYLYTLEDGSLVRKFEGHKDYLHWIEGDSSQIASASEDGTVKMWDLNQQSFTNELAPYKEEKLQRPKIGKWVGCVTINQDWLVCGGGPKLSLWHLRSLEMSTVYDLPNCGIHVTSFVDDHILAAGGSGHVYQMTYDGTLLSDIATTPTAVYSVVHRNIPKKVMSIAGSSNILDISTSFSYKDQVIAFK